MHRFALALLLGGCVLGLFAVAQPTPPKTEVRLNGHGFTLPPGYEIELIAGPPLVERPITADFDAEGRLYVTDSSGSNEKVQVQLEKKPHRVVRLEDVDGDGRFDRRTVFAERMMFPEGSLWHEGSLYVAAPPSIWKLTDSDGDGKADQSSEWFQGKTLTGCANDLHGPYAGPDGWIYWCKGAFAEQTYPRSGKPPFVTKASHIFRCRPDGTGLEPVMTGGMDNPVDVVFTPGGERLFTTTFFQHPAGGKRDGMIHAVYGGIYGKVHDPIFAPSHLWTGPQVMPVLTHMGAAAPCGLTRLESTASLGEECRDNVFACQFNMHKVSRHLVVPEGASFRTQDSDFVVSSNLDFHPTDVLEDADGSLIIVDTGGWYKLCCPTSQLVKPDILGGIYRVRRKGAPRVDDPRGRKIPWDKLDAPGLARYLEDPRPVVRKRAVAGLSRKETEGAQALATVLQTSSSVEARRQALWAAARLESPQGRKVVRSGLADTEETVRQVALHAISLYRDRDAVPALMTMLNHTSAHNRRGAAECLGRIGAKEAVPGLLKALESVGEDRFLDHAYTYALIEIGDGQATAVGLKNLTPSVRRATLTALDQMGGTGLTVPKVAAELLSPHPSLKETASWIVGRHPEWGGALAGFFQQQLSNRQIQESDREALAGLLARLARTPAIQDLLAKHMVAPSTPESRRVALRAVAESGLKEAPPSWLEALAEVIPSNDPESVRLAVAAARAIPPGKGQGASLATALRSLGQGKKHPIEVRFGALAAIPGGLTSVPNPVFDELRQHLDREQPVALRALAVDILARARLVPEQLQSLIESFQGVGPMEIDRLIDAFVTTPQEGLGLGLIAALSKSPARASLRVDALRPRLAKFGPKIAPEAEALYSRLDADAAGQRAKLETMLTSLPTGDIRRGQSVFNGTKAACVSCHAIGYLGGKIGPDLTRIGQIRTERDLLESIVFPSASLVRSYEPVQVTTRSGKVINGLVRKEAPDEVILATNATEESRIPRAQIEEILPSKVSIMPAGLDQQLSVQDLADLVAFLRACK